MHELFTLPEFFQLLSYHLDCLSLSSCILVSRHWSEMLTPQLWGRFGSMAPTLKPDGHVQSLWERFSEGTRLSADEVKIVQVLVDKNNRHLQTVVIRSPQVFQIYQAHCTNLRVIHCEWRRPEVSLVDEEVERVRQDIERFVKQQQSCLHSIYLSGWMVSDEIRRMAASSIKHFQDLDAPLRDEDYHYLGSLLPYVESIRLAVNSLAIVSDPLEHTHLHLKKMSLDVPSLSHEFLQTILVSFPNIKNLVVRAENNDDQLPQGQIDIDIENGSRLRVTGVYDGDAKVADMIAVIPNLKSVDYFGLGRKCFEALARHCPHLKDVEADCGAQSLIADSEYDIIPVPTINLLLTSCPDLESVNCPDHTIHIRHIMEGGPWVCKNLMFLRCQFVGVPRIAPWDEDLYESLEDRRLEISDEETSSLSDKERELLNIVKRRELCCEAMEEQFSFVPKVKERGFFGDYMNEQFLPC
ncbi:hypothetical protein BGZ96_009135 [Linnemannia gamsii]|uniref:F-box domain-containing protein n=1 Tax=Linnemannia gamsii TaxID=64522 RepID=A0ABQ7KEK9_9FUNG|nr:hypothetical protein BGZ96_009135 [Linnemannia gamsii]